MAKLMWDWQVRFTTRNHRPFLAGYTKEGWVYTSPIACADGKVVITSSGTIYELKSPVDNPLEGIVFKPLTLEDKLEIRAGRLTKLLQVQDGS